MPGEVDVRPSSPCLGFGVIATGGCEGVVAFFSRNSRYPWLKRLPDCLILERAYYCLVWSGTSACRLGFTHFRICWAGPFGHDVA